MSSLSKNLLLGLTAACIIAVIVFCIQLIVINSGVDRARPGTISTGAGQGDDADGEEPPDGDNGDGEDGIATPVTTPRPPPQGARYELLITDNSRLLVYARDENFEYEEGDLKWLFTYIAGGSASLEISFTMIPPAQGAAEYTEAFLNRYSGAADAQFLREEMIHGSGINGYHASAIHGGETFEVWIHNLVESDIALAFIIRYENDQQKEALYEVLSTLDIIRLGDAFIPPPDHGIDGDGTGGVDGTDTDGGAANGGETDPPEGD